MMKPGKLFFTLLALLTISACNSPSSKAPVDWVDPQIGSVHGRWFFYTPAARPFGMVKLAPTTNAYGSIGSWLPCGYDNRHTSIEGFAHLHEFQIGGIVTIPTVGELKTLPATDSLPDSGYRSRIDKATEVSHPGYYSVMMTDYNVKAEITSTMRAGMHRYTFPKSDQSRILFDIGHPQGESAQVVDCHVEYLPQSMEVVGWLETYPVYATFCQPGATIKAYFAAKTDKTPVSVGTFIDSLVTNDTTSVNGAGAGMFLNFATEDQEVVQMQVGVSFTSIDNARNNREVETKGKDFDTVVADSRNEWNQALSRIEVEGGTDSDKTKFYTGLYHALLGRGTANDVNGQYITYNKTIGQIPLNSNGEPQYSSHNSDGMWGCFWNLTQLWTMAYPEVFSSYINSNLDFYKDSGWLHDGHAAGIYVNGVQTNFQSVAINAAYQAGIRDYDMNLAWDAVRKNELDYKGRDMGNGKYDNEYFITGEYIPLKEYLSVSVWVTLHLIT